MYIFLILSQIYLVTGLTEGEKTGILALMESFPEFTYSWPSDPAQFCSTSIVMDSALVLQCSTGEDPHITVLYALLNSFDENSHEPILTLI